MSNKFYNELWQEAIGDIMDQVQQENLPLEQNEGQFGMTHQMSN